MDKDASISSPPKSTLGKILYIGGSISCGSYPWSPRYFHSPPPNGCLDAFPYVAQRILAQQDPPKVFGADLISYPDWTLVTPNEQEKERRNPPGMEDKLLRVSPGARTHTPISNRNSKSRRW
ncbi:hypothetical protein FRC08_015481 [Ceratobasidium sp. 394]|nr:hypothetical protein FRC08_015481 [Ceratobasidium sp. 394]